MNIQYLIAKRFKYVLFALLTLPLTLMHSSAQIEITEVFDTGEGIYAGILLSGDHAFDKDGEILTVNDYGLEEANVIIDIASATGLFSAAIATDDGNDKTFNLVNAIIKGSTGNDGFVFGFLYANGDQTPTGAEVPAYIPFDGSINGKILTVENSTGAAIGAAFLNIDDFDATGEKWGALGNAALTFGNITVNGAGAEGFASGETASDTEIILGSLTIDGGNRQAKGVLIAGNHAGKLTTGSITATGGSAFGIQIGDMDPFIVGDKKDTGSISVGGALNARAEGTAVGMMVTGIIEGNGTITLGEVNAVGRNNANEYAEQAVGFLAVGGIENAAAITVGDITAKGIRSAAGFGVGNMQTDSPDITATVSDSTITLGKLNITATESAAFGWLSGEVENNASITIGDIAVDGAGASGVYVAGHYDGRLRTGAITADGGENENSNETTSGIAILGNFRTGTGTANRSTVGNIEVEATTSEHVYGIVLSGASGAGNTGSLTGELTVGNITATNNGTGDSFGWDSGTISQGAVLTVGTITAKADNFAAFGIRIDGETVGNITRATDATITVTSGDGEGARATGFFSSGKNTGNITLGNIMAGGHLTTAGALTAVGNRAAGVHFTQNVEGNLITGDITAMGKNETLGLHIGNAYNASGPTTAANLLGSATLGKIAVTSTEANAFGIRIAGGAEKLTLGGDVTATGTGTETSGIRSYGDTNIILNKDDIETGIRIAATRPTSATGTYVGADIWTTGALSVHLDGKNLTTARVKVEGDASGLAITGAGHADLGIVTVESGQFVVGGNNTDTRVTLSVDNLTNTNASNFTDTSGNELHAGSTLILEGRIPVGRLLRLGNFDVRAGSVTGGMFTTFDWDAGFIRARRTNANMSDGYLAAFTIHNRMAAWNVLQNHLISAESYAGNGYRGQSAYGFDRIRAFYPNNGNGISNGLHAWANYSGRSDTYQSAFNGQEWRLSAEGAQIGTDFIRSNLWQFGMLLGFDSGKMVQHWNNVDADDIYLGLYAAQVLRSGADIRGVLAYGWQDYDMNRFDANSRWYFSSFKGNTVEAHLELGQRLSGGPWSLRPVIALDVLNNRLKGGEEFEVDSNATIPDSAPDESVIYNKANLTQVFLRTGAELQFTRNFFTLNGGIFYANDLNGADMKATVVSAVDNYYSADLLGTKLSRSRLSFNAAGTFQVTQFFSIIGGYQGEYAFDRDNQVQNSGHIGGSWKW